MPDETIKLEIDDNDDDKERVLSAEMSFIPLELSSQELQSLNDVSGDAVESFLKQFDEENLAGQCVALQAIYTAVKTIWDNQSEEPLAAIVAYSLMSIGKLHNVGKDFISALFLSEALKPFAEFDEDGEDDPDPENN